MSNTALLVNCFTLPGLVFENDVVLGCSLKVPCLYWKRFSWKFFLICRSKRQEVFCKTGVLKNVGKLTGKHLYRSLFFNKVADLRPAALAEKRLQHRSLPENLRWLLLDLLQFWWNSNSRRYACVWIYWTMALNVYLKVSGVFHTCYLYLKKGIFSNLKTKANLFSSRKRMVLKKSLFDSKLIRQLL